MVELSRQSHVYNIFKKKKMFFENISFSKSIVYTKNRDGNLFPMQLNSINLIKLQKKKDKNKELEIPISNQPTLKYIFAMQKIK